LFSNVAKSQITGEYYCTDRLDNRITYVLNIYENNMYEIRTSYSMLIDLHTSLILSHGYYRKFNDTLYLTDYYNEYILHFIINNDQLVAKKAFKSFVNSIFKKYKEQHLRNTTDMVFQERTLIYARSDYEKDHKTKFKLTDSIFGKEGWITLRLKPNKKYQLNCYGSVVSEGSWKRKGNELICRDSILQHNFYLSIGKNKIINRFYPYNQMECQSEYGGCILEGQ